MNNFDVASLLFKYIRCDLFFDIFIKYIILTNNLISRLSYIILLSLFI